MLFELTDLYRKDYSCAKIFTWSKKCYQWEFNYQKLDNNTKKYLGDAKCFKIQLKDSKQSGKKTIIINDVTIVYKEQIKHFARVPYTIMDYPMKIQIIKNNKFSDTYDLLIEGIEFQQMKRTGKQYQLAIEKGEFERLEQNILKKLNKSHQQMTSVRQEQEHQQPVQLQNLNYQDNQHNQNNYDFDFNNYFCDINSKLEEKISSITKYSHNNQFTCSNSDQNIKKSDSNQDSYSNNQLLDFNFFDIDKENNQCNYNFTLYNNIYQENQNNDIQYNYEYFSQFEVPIDPQSNENIQKIQNMEDIRQNKLIFNQSNQFY